MKWKYDVRLVKAVSCCIKARCLMNNGCSGFIYPYLFQVHQDSVTACLDFCPSSFHADVSGLVMLALYFSYPRLKLPSHAQKVTLASTARSKNRAFTLAESHSIPSIARHFDGIAIFEVHPLSSRRAKLESDLAALRRLQQTAVPIARVAGDGAGGEDIACVDAAAITRLLHEQVRKRPVHSL